MRKRKIVIGTLVVAMIGLALAAPACSGGSGEPRPAPTPTAEPRPAIEVLEPSSRITGERGAVYMTLRNNADAPDYLTAAWTEVAARVELHETTMQGAMSMMQPVEKIEVPAKGEAVLKRGGYHIMLMELTRELKEGDSFEVLLTFQNAGVVKVIVTVPPLVQG